MVTRAGYLAGDGMAKAGVADFDHHDECPRFISSRATACVLTSIAASLRAGGRKRVEDSNTTAPRRQH